jgi:hypothetical protein
VSASPLRAALDAVTGEHGCSLKDLTVLEFLRLAEALPDLVLGVGQRLEELAVGAVPGAVLPVSLAACVVAGGGAWVERPGGGGQASDGGRVDARALRARQDREDRLDQVAGVLEHFRAREEGFLVSGHDSCLPLRSVA